MDFVPVEDWKRGEKGNFDAIYRQGLLVHASPFAPKRVGLGMAQSPVNALDPVNVVPDLKLEEMGETRRDLAKVQLKVTVSLRGGAGKGEMST
jgi:hypothetical protein